MTRTIAQQVGPMSVPQLAEVLGVSRVTAYKRVRSGAIPAQMIGHSYVIPAETVAALVEERASRIEDAVKRVVAEYGSALERLGRE